jgi:hypothetical protein
MAPATEADLAARLDALPGLVNADPWLVHRGRFVTLALRLDIGAVSCHVAIERGRIEAVERGPFLMRAFTFAVRGSVAGWRLFWQPCPPPHYHDIFALAKAGEFRIEGELQPLMANLLYFKDVLAAPRRAEPAP